MAFLGILGGLGGGLGGLGNLGGLLGQGKTLIDTGSILGEPDGGKNTPVIDLDVDAAPRAQPQESAVSIGLLPELSPGHGLIDADILSGSYGASALVVADIGPDGIGPILSGTILANPDKPIDLQLLGTPLPDIGGLLGGLNPLDA